MPNSVRAFFEPRFGYDFSQIRIHRNSELAETARQLEARAFTRGKDIVFAEGEYAPETPRGKVLLAHELIHTVQQSQNNTSVHVQTNAEELLQRQVEPETLFST